MANRIPRASDDDDKGISLRMQAADRDVISYAAALEQTDLITFIVRAALQEARAVIARHNSNKLTVRDSRRVMELLEHPPAANTKLRKAARALPERK